MSNPLLNDVAARAAAYLDTLGDRPVAPQADAVRDITELAGEPLADEPADPAAVIAALDRIGSPATTANAGPRYFGFVTGGALPVTVAANWLAAAWDQNAFSHVASPTAVLLEETALRWINEILGLPADAAGSVVTGATVANLVCLAAARNRVLAQAGWDVEVKGLFGAPEITVVTGEEAHATLFKSLGVLGLGRDRVVKVPVDNQGRMRADAVPDLSGPTILCLQAGNVNSGAFDPARDIIGPARDAGAWVHVDGAFGLWAAAAPALAHLMDGFADAHSWATDGHKWLNVPYDCGIAIVTDREALSRAMSTTGAYYPAPSDHREPLEFSPESSRRARGIELWAALKTLGREGLAELFERNCRQARRFAEGLAAAGYEVLNEVVLNQVVVAFGDETRTQAVISAIQADGTCWCGATHWRGRAAMRISVSSWATRDEDVERSLEAILTIASRSNA